MTKSRFISSACTMAMAVAVALLAACNRNVVTYEDMSPFASMLLNDSIPMLDRLVEQSGKTSGSIVVIGEPARCSEVAMQFIESDKFDNISGSIAPDHLPDFAGETIVAVMDFANTPYESYLEEGDDSPLKEVALRTLLAAMDSAIACKVIVLCSPLLSEHAAEEVTDFLSLVESDVHVIASDDPEYPFTKACYKLLRARNAFTHEIAHPELCTFMTVRNDPKDRSFELIPCEGLHVPVFESLDTLSAAPSVDTLAAKTKIESQDVPDQH